ncbi:MAG: radical SAM protein, partial [Candidatus Omnitrophica bacterium]|nr:radical SAM protein [Candidatus Omnitrophota bacterium]
SRVDTINDDLARAMKEAGCELISFGVESGNPEILESTKKGITLDQVREGVGAAKRAGIMTFCYFIIGLPGETEETIQDTIDFAKELDPDYCNFHVATPFPGTELYEQAKREGWLVHEDWDQYEEMGSAVMKTPSLSPEAAMRAQTRATRAIYLRPKRIVKELGRMRSMKDVMIRSKAALRLLGVTQGEPPAVSEVE